jgi:hypothetical protein
MNYNEFKREYKKFRVDGFKDVDYFKELIKQIICNENEMKVIYQTIEELNGSNFVYDRGLDALCMVHGLTQGELGRAYMWGIAHHMVDKELGTKNNDLFSLKTLALINLLISTLGIGKEGDFSKFYRYALKENPDLDFEEILDDINRVYRKILKMCL